MFTRRANLFILSSISGLIVLFSCLDLVAKENLIFQRLLISDGLSNNSINAILQTQDGFLWIATKDGLNRYDGQRFKIYKNIYGDSTSLSENYVMSLAESSDGKLWVGTWGGGLQQYDHLNESFISYKSPGLEDEFIQCIFEDRMHDIWYGTTDGGLFRLSVKSGTVENFAKDIPGARPFPSNNITCIIQDENLSIWVSTWEDGLIRFNPNKGTFIQYLHDAEDPSSIADNGVWDMRHDNDNKLLISTFSGVDRFNTVTGQALHNPDVDSGFKSLMPTPIRQTFRDRDGRLWIGTYQYLGLFMLSQEANGEYKTMRYINEDGNENSITMDRIRCIYEDMKGNIWIGTENGLNKIPVHQPFRQYTYLPVRPNSLGGRVVSSILKGSKGNLWVGYGGGGFDKINIESNEITHFKSSNIVRNSLSDNDVISVNESKEGEIWICTMNGGLNRFDPEKNIFTIYKSELGNDKSICCNWVLQVLETSDSTLMVGTNNGLDIFDCESESFSRFDPEINEGLESFPKNLSVNVLFEDSKRNVWIGTWLDGVFCYNAQDKTLKQYIHDANDPYSISSDKITVIYEDSAGIWFGTHSGGLNRLDEDNGKFYHFNTQNGLPNDVVFGIQSDSKGNLWVSTMKGLAKMDKFSGSLRVYDHLDGLVNNQFNWRASFKDKHGIMYFGGINGFVSFNPDSIKIDTTPPIVAVTKFTVFNKQTGKQETFPSTRELTLEHDQNFFSIEFIALDMAPNQKHQYAYMLEGIDKNWVMSGSRNTAFYTDLHKGSFRFLLKASNADNIWSEPAVLPVIILPAWYNTFWVKLFGLLAIFGIGILVSRIRFWQLLEIERIRLNIASDLHDEIGSNLSSISVDSQQLMLLTKNSDKGLELSSDIYKTTNETIDSIRDIIWFINPKNDSGDDMLFKMREKAVTLLAGMEWNFFVSEGFKLDSLKLEVRRNLFLIYKETLTNVVRHSRAKSCKIELIQQTDNIILNICDNGIGFNPNNESHSGGLSNLYHRAKKIGAKIEIKGNSSSGTCVGLVLPVKFIQHRKKRMK